MDTKINDNLIICDMFISAILKDSVPINLIGYNIEGNNYFMLRDVARYFDFGLGCKNKYNINRF